MADDIIKGSQLNSAGFGTIPKLAMQDTRLHIAAKAIYAYFCSFAGAGDTCFPSRKKICYDLGISTDTFGKYLKQLCDFGYIKTQQVKENGRFSHNVYTICSTILPCPKISDTEDIVHDNLDTNINSINNNNYFNNNSSVIKKERKPKSGYDVIICEYTMNDELKEAIYEFIKMRKMMKKPMTDRALKGIFNKLDKFGRSDGEKIAILDQSIQNSWQGVYELKEPYQEPEQPQKKRKIDWDNLPF